MKILNEKTGKKEDVRLPKAFKKKWVAALRSGEFKQCEGSLEDYLPNSEEKIGHCCLGVACRIVHPKMDLFQKGFADKGSFKSKLPNIKIPLLLKGDDENIVVKTLSEMNDKGKSFKFIAAYIEKNL